MTTILNGKEYSIKFRQELKEKVATLKEKHGIVPGLAVVIIGEDSASQIYVRNKIKASEDVGLNSVTVRLSEDITQEEAENEVYKLACRPDIDGIIVQLPLPKKFDSAKILSKIPTEKDVDGLCAENLGKLLVGEDALISCTPNGIIQLLKGYGIEFNGKHAVVLGRSNMVGKPISALLQKENCTVTMCHSKTQNIKNYTLQADILVAAIGRANFVTGDMVKEGAIVVDVGINRVDGKIYGDVDYNAVFNKASYITPVPGGVGPMTVTMLMFNAFTACLRNNNIE